MGGGGMGMGGGGMGGGMGMMRVPAEKLVKVGANTVCLEQGKPDPTPQMAYNIVPIDQVTGDDRVKDLCKMVARGELPTNVGQALAWHLANDLSWEKLASLDRVRSRYTGNIKYFNPQELNYAMKVYGEKFNSKPSKSEYDNYGSKSTGKVSASSSSSTVLTSSND